MNKLNCKFSIEALSLTTHRRNKLFKILKLSLEFNYIISTTLLFFRGASIRLAIIRHGQIWFVSFELLSLQSYIFEFSFLLDFYSLMFCGAVRLISGCVVLYSHIYINREKFFLRFHLVLLSFVLRIFLLIFCVNLIALIVG